MSDQLPQPGTPYPGDIKTTVHGTYVDRYGNPIMNSAGEMFDTPLEIELTELTMSEKGVDSDSKIARLLGSRVLSITEIIEESSLPDGEHEGVWGGYIVKLKVNAHCYELRTEIGIRTMAAPCIVTVKDGIASVRAK